MHSLFEKRISFYRNKISFFCSVCESDPAKAERYAHHCGTKNPHNRMKLPRGFNPPSESNKNHRQHKSLPVKSPNGLHRNRSQIGYTKKSDGGHRKARGYDKASGGRPEAYKNRIYKTVITEALQKARNYQDNNDRRGNEAKSRYDGPRDPCSGISHISSHIHPHRAGGGFRNRNHIRQLAMGKPSSSVCHIA